MLVVLVLVLVLVLVPVPVPVLVALVLVLVLGLVPVDHPSQGQHAQPTRRNAPTTTSNRRMRLAVLVVAPES